MHEVQTFMLGHARPDATLGNGLQQIILFGINATRSLVMYRLSKWRHAACEGLAAMACACICMIVHCYDHAGTGTTHDGPVTAYLYLLAYLHATLLQVASASLTPTHTACGWFGLHGFVCFVRHQCMTMLRSGLVML